MSRGLELPPLEYPIVRGRLTRIEYDDHGTITALHLAEPHGGEVVIRVDMPEVLVDALLEPGPVPPFVSFDRAWPEVTVARIVR